LRASYKIIKSPFVYKNKENICENVIVYYSIIATKRDNLFFDKGIGEEKGVFKKKIKLFLRKKCVFRKK